MNTGELIRTEKKDGIAIVTLSRSDGMNILDTEMLLGLSQCLLDLQKDDRTRVVIITGEGNFSSGGDIKEMKDKTPEEAGIFSKLGHQVCTLIENMEKVVIAAVNGLALGGGCELALACDMRIAAGNARFGQPELSLGLIPGFGGTQRLPRLVGPGKAKELILTGRIIDAKEAEAIGLVNGVVKNDELMERAEEMARLLAQKSPRAAALSKKLINDNQEIAGGLRREMISFSECFATQDHREGIAAFLEKRMPKFKGE
jgi:enoyl-CoA hydratase